MNIIAAVCTLAVAAQARPAQKSEIEKAESLYEQSLDLSENANHARAHAILFEAVNLWQKAGSNDRAIESLVRSASFHRSQGRWQYAIECLRRLLEIKELSVEARTSALTSTAQVYFELRAFDPAEACYRRAMNLARRTRDRNAEALCLLGLAAIYAEQGDTARARAHIDGARILGGSKRSEADALRLIGRIYYSQNRYGEAREAIERSLAIYRTEGDAEEQAMAICSLSNILLATGQKQDAFERAKEAMALWDSGSEYAWRGWFALARAQRALAQSREALKSFYRASIIIEKHAIQLSLDSLKIGFIEERQAAYREMADLLIELGRPDEAFLTFEHARSRSALDMLACAERTGGRADQKVSWGQPPRAYTERLNSFVRPATLKHLQKEVLRPGEALIEFALIEARSHVWLITADKMLVSSLPGRAEIDRDVRQYVDILSTKPSNLYLKRDLARQKERAAALFVSLLGAFKDELPRQSRLVIVPDGPLHYLPFETLVSDGRYLIERHTISYAPSASVLGVLRRRAARQGSYSMELLAFADPAISGQGSRRLSNAGRLQPIPNTRAEVISISRMFPTLSRVYLGEDMKEEAIKRESLRSFRRLHLATHGVADERTPSRSSIVFALDDDPAEDGFLTVDEIVGLDLDSETVVLSACQTGRGRVMSGEGVLGLARSFLFAGARSMVVSLWNVDDVSSSELMKSLYRSFAAGEETAQSLRKAKLELIARGKALGHPYHWAPFVVVGP